MPVRHLGGLLLLVCLTACASEPSLPADASAPRTLPPSCPHWSLRVYTPEHMEAWVETILVMDDHGELVRIPQGMAGELRQTAGWGDLRVGGGGASIDHAGAPLKVYVRWQSLAEPQTYHWEFTVSDDMRRALSRMEMGKTWYGPPQMTCHSEITVVVAPGGRAIVWIVGNGLAPIEIMRGQAEVEPLGPGQGWGKGYAYPLSDEARKYIDEHGIPYGSW